MWRPFLRKAKRCSCNQGSESHIEGKPPHLRVLVVHYSLNFTAYKAASRGVFLRCRTLSLGYNCTS